MARTRAKPGRRHYERCEKKKSCHQARHTFALPFPPGGFWVAGRNAPGLCAGAGKLIFDSRQDGSSGSVLNAVNESIPEVTEGCNRLAAGCILPE